MLSQSHLFGEALPPGWMTLSSDDEYLYSSFFQRTEDCLSYENNWCQGRSKRGPLRRSKREPVEG
jgi:hypothetical protein